LDSFTTPINSTTRARVVPFYAPELARTRPFRFAPNITIPAGQLVIASTTNTNAIQTATVTGTPTAGGQAFVITNPLTLDTTTVTIPYNATAAVAQGLVNAVPQAAGNITVGGGAWPGTPLTFTFSGGFGAMPVPVITNGASTLNAGATAAIANTTPGLTQNLASAYSGTGNLIGISEYAVATDANGNLTLGAVSTGGFFGEKVFQAPVWVKGMFLVADLTGVDAGAVTALGRCEPALGQVGAVLHMD
jgi:hypothetical protein